MNQVSLRPVLISAMVGLVAFSLGITQLTTFLSNEEVLVDQMQTILERDAVRAAEQTEQFLQPAERAASQTASLLATGGLSLDDPALLQQHLLTVLGASPPLDGIFFGQDNGDFYYLNRSTDRPGATFRLKTIQTSPGRIVTLTWLNQEGRPVASEVDPEDTYDPTARPWFAAANRGETWTSPYVFFSSRAPGITAAAPVTTEGTFNGVVGVDVQLASLSQSIGSLLATENSSATLFTETLQVLASADTATVTVEDGEGGLRFIELGELRNTNTRAAIELLDSDADLANGQTLVFDGSLGRHHAVFAPVPTLDLGWIIAIDAPEADYLGAVTRNNRANLLLSVLIGIVASVVGYLLAQAIARPMRRLQADALAVVGGDGTTVATSTSRFSEINDATQALNVAYSELEALVDERTEALNTEIVTRREAEIRATAASHSKSVFLANMSHELRTPLTAIIGYAGLLESMGDSLSDEEKHEHYEIIRSSADHLLELINDVLDLSRIEAGELQLEETEVDLDALFESVTKMLSPRARDRQVSLTSHAPNGIGIIADQRRIRQIIINLVSNSLKFTPPKGAVSVSATEEDGQVTITVNDTGIGMTPEELKIALEQFGQVANELTDKSEGTGLGLALTKLLAESHEASFRLSSVKGQGTTAIVVFPRSRTVAHSPTS